MKMWAEFIGITSAIVASICFIALILTIVIIFMGNWDTINSNRAFSMISVLFTLYFGGSIVFYLMSRITSSK